MFLFRVPAVFLFPFSRFSRCAYSHSPHSNLIFDHILRYTEGRDNPVKSVTQFSSGG